MLRGICIVWKKFLVKQMKLKSYSHTQKETLSGDFQYACGKMHPQILLGVWWCAMFIFLLLKFYNFIEGIMHIHSIFKKPKTNVFTLHLLTF